MIHIIEIYQLADLSKVTKMTDLNEIISHLFIVYKNIKFQFPTSLLGKK